MPKYLAKADIVSRCPPGRQNFTKQLDGSFFFAGVINGVSLKARITPTATLQYAFHALATGSLPYTVNPEYVTLIIGGDSGAISVTASVGIGSLHPADAN